MSAEAPPLSPALAARLAKREDQHKYDHGHVLVLSGGVGRGGAARLAARAALRVGAGLVTLGCPPAAILENAARLDAVMLARIGDAAALTERLADKRLNALCLGPGLGTGQGKEDATQALVLAALAARRATLLDADALTAFEGDPQRLFDALHGQCVLTPHAGEFARLFPDAARALKADRNGAAAARRDAVAAAASAAGAVVLLKGADTVIADAGGRSVQLAARGAAAAPWLATAGAGDVLAGLIAGLLGRGFSPMQAAEAGAWLHAAAARRVGPGLIAEDLPEAIPLVFADLGL